MNRFPVEHQWEKLSFQQYGVVLLSQALVHGHAFSETIHKAEWYIQRVHDILTHMEQNTLFQKIRAKVHEDIEWIVVFTEFMKAYLESREKFLTIEPIGRIEHLTHALVRLISLGNLTHAQSLLIHKLCRFHSILCDTLNQVEEKTFANQWVLE